MQDGPFTYQHIIILKLQAGFRREEFSRGDSVEGVILLALSFRFLLTHLEGFNLDQAFLQEASWQVDLLQYEACSITSSPKQDTYSYLKAFHDTRKVFLRLLSQLELPCQV